MWRQSHSLTDTSSSYSSLGVPRSVNRAVACFCNTLWRHIRHKTVVSAGVLCISTKNRYMCIPYTEGFDTGGNPVRQCRNQLEITQKINGNQLEIEEINQKSQKIWSGAREGGRSNRLTDRFLLHRSSRELVVPCAKMPEESSPGLLPSPRAHAP